MSRINFKAILDEVVPLNEIKTTSQFHIANIVSTVELLDFGETVSLESLSLLYNGVIKYQPKLFAAAILRVKDLVSVTTCLIYRNGKLVVVGAKSYYHAVMVCQMYRQMIEKAVGVYKQKQNGCLCNSNLIGRTLFKNWNVRNIIANDTLQFKPNLKRLIEIIPEISNWNPDLFPGLILNVWLSPKRKCHCIVKKNDGTCTCCVRALVFDSKKFIITGSKTVQAAMKARHIIIELFDEESLQDHSVYDQSLNNFQKRKQKILEAAEIEFTGGIKQEPKREDTAIDKILKGIKFVHEQINEEDMSLEPLQKAKKYNQIENIKLLSSFILENSP